MHIHELRKLAQVASFQRLLALHAQLFDEVQILHHGLVHAFGFVVLLLQNLRRRARVAGEKEQQVVLQIEERFLGEFHRDDLHFSSRQKVEGSHATDRRDVLILLADGLVQFLQLDLAGLRGDLHRAHDVLFVSVQRFQQRRGETAGRTESAAGGDVGHRGDLQRAPVHLQKRARFTHDRMLQPARVLHTLKPRVFHDEVVHEGFVERDIDILVDRRGDEEPAMLLVVGREIRAAAAERDPEWRARDDHAPKW